MNEIERGRLGDIKGSQRIPRATYRLQFNRQFTFQQVREIADYLHELGISDLYASPLFRATPHSTHGYDVCAFDQFNPNLGTPADFDRLTERLRELGMGLLLDVVPNHMAADLSNPWWRDVLEKGKGSSYASWFDIEWRTTGSALHDKVLVPVLEDRYGQVLEEGKLQVRFERGQLGISYYERKFPLSPQSYPVVLQQVMVNHNPEGPVSPELEARLKSWASLGVTATAGFKLETLQEDLRQLHESSPEFRTHLSATLRTLNGIPGEPRSFDALDQLLRLQHYRLAWWRLGQEEIDYRRFFDIAELISLRMELPQVFEASHRLVLDLLCQNKVTGLRIDHPDGLWNPKAYLERLQEDAGLGAPLYIVVEKILTGDESLPTDWPVAGTTGYEFLNRLNGIFVKRSSQAAFDSLYLEFTGSRADFASTVYAGKIRTLRYSFMSELQALTWRLKDIAADSRFGQDLTFRQLQGALREVIAAFPVYRTYITEETQQVTASEREYILQAIGIARNAIDQFGVQPLGGNRLESARAQHFNESPPKGGTPNQGGTSNRSAPSLDYEVPNPRLDAAALHFIEKLLLLELPEGLDEAGRRRCREWVMKFQQLTGPNMAKGLEDTALYNFNRLVSLNDVGGDPGTFGTDMAVFHSDNLRKAERWPDALLATATHDTKRGEDLRARLNVLSEMPEEWRAAITRWTKLNADKKAMADGVPAPHRNDEYLFYQTLVGAWLSEGDTQEGLMALRERLVAYMLKAGREAKAFTSWTDPNRAYENATKVFVEAVLSQASSSAFLEDFKAFQQRVSFFGVFNSLSQVLLKMTAPGVPDFYQGTELWDFSLVDPDNRRPVDFELRRKALVELKRCVTERTSDFQDLAAELIRDASAGWIKLFLVWRVLQFRRDHAALFARGGYVPLAAIGAKAEHVCAFQRDSGQEQAIIVAPRLVYGLMSGLERVPIGLEIWDDTVLPIRAGEPGAQYQNVLTGERVAFEQSGLALGKILAVFPVALLEKAGRT
jgi:(1->4)-alpha-D-glucan 1-alpha-D-glucosylmutase